MVRTIRISVAGLLIICSAFPRFATAATPAANVSVLELITQPERFDGKTVAVIGFVDFSSDGILLYVHREDSENWIAQNAIWVKRNDLLDRTQGSLNRKYVKIIGTFKMGHRQQLGTPSNGFTDIEEIKLWSDPASPVGRKKIPGGSNE